MTCNKLYIMKLVFISDLHLSPHTVEKNIVFLSLMKNWMGNISALYILGDFFDYWLGDDDVNTFTTEMKRCFNKFTKSTPIYFISGNHDFGIGKRFAKETGIQILKDCHLLEDGNKRVLLSHGDIFCTLDKGYQRMKKILQNPLTKYILKKIPLAWRYKLKNMLEKQSNDAYNPNRAHKYKVVDKTIAKYAKKFNANVIIHGHTHDPNYYTVTLKDGSQIQRIEIPDWVHRKPGGYVEFNLDKFNIHI
ncbi:MAG: UDP-2,3-diacylglucosamine diphosphatase [Neisseriaceae bacterium]